MLKVCLVNSFYEPDVLGGAEVSVKILAEHLNKRGIEVFIICTGDYDKIEYINGIKVYRVKSNNICTTKNYIKNNRGINKISKLLYKSIEINNILNKRKFKKILQEENPNIMHVNNIYGLSSSIWHVAHKMDIKIVQTLRDYFIMCPKSTLIKSDNMKCIKENLACSIYRNIYIHMSKNIDYITAPSNHTLGEFINTGYFKNIKSECIYNAIDIDIDKVNKLYEYKINKKRDKIKFVYLGALVRHKGIIELIDAFKNIDSKINVELHIAGKGELENYIIDICSKSKNIKYHGFLNSSYLEKLLYKMDVLVAPSKWEEPFGRIVLDAYKNAMPVIVSSNGGLKEIVENKSTGIILSDVSESDIRNAISYFTDEKNIVEMLYNAKKMLEKFTIDNQVDRFIKIYNSSLE